MIQLLEFCIFCIFFSYLPGNCLKYAACLFFFYFFERQQTKFLRKLFTIEFASGMDLVFNYEDNQNKSTIISCTIITENFNENFKALISKNIEKEKKYHKLKEILYHNTFFAYWKKDPKYNPDNHFEFIDKELKDEKEIYQKMGEELSTPFPNDHPKWKFFVFKKYKKTKGAVIMKFHHSLVDGISLLSFFLKSCEVENVKFVKMPKISMLKWIFIYISLPVLGVYYLFMNVIKKQDRNKIHNFELSGKKKVFTLQMNRNLTDLKVISKGLRISINDLFTSVLMECLQEYYKDKFKEEFKESIMFMPVSMRSLPPPGITCPLNNTMITLFAKMKMIKGDDKELVAKGYGKMLTTLKNSLEAPILFLLIHYAPKLLPNFVFQNFYKFMAIKPSLGFTNVPGPLEEVKYGRASIENIFFYVPTVSSIGLGFSLFTYNNKLMFGVQADEKTQINPEMFTKKYEQVMDIYIDQAMKRAGGNPNKTNTNTKGEKKPTKGEKKKK